MNVISHQRDAADLEFFRRTRTSIGSREMRALRHGMAGQPGFELMGPWEDYGARRAEAARSPYADPIKLRELKMTA